MFCILLVHLGFLLPLVVGGFIKISKGEKLFANCLKYSYFFVLA